MIEFNCQYCSRVLRTADDKAGLRAKCPDCGAEVQVPAASVSTGDDASIPEEDSPEVEDTRVCPMCGERIKAAAKVCRFCGESLGKPRSRSNLAPHRGGLILVLGILSWLVCPFFGIAAWLMGGTDLKEMDAGRMDPEGRGLTQAGRIIGIIVFALNVVILLGIVAFMILMAVLGH